MSRKDRERYNAGAFDWPTQDEDPAVGPNWSDRSSRQQIADPWSDGRFGMHTSTPDDHEATARSESARWPAGPAERQDIGYASDEALQAARSNVNPEPLAAAAAEIAMLNQDFTAPSMTREQAAVADSARHDQAAARLTEIAQLERLLELPGDIPNN